MWRLVIAGLVVVLGIVLSYFAPPKPLPTKLSPLALCWEEGLLQRVAEKVDSSRLYHAPKLLRWLHSIGLVSFEEMTSLVVGLNAPPSSASNASSDASFHLKGVPEIDAHCMPKERHYYRSVDGSCNWVRKGEYLLGSVNQSFGRDRAPHYADNLDQPRKAPPRATPRALSNAFFNASKQKVREWDHTPFLVGYVEFLVHDILRSHPSTEARDKYKLSVPKEDTFFNQTDDLWFTRAERMPGTGAGTDKPRENRNRRSIWLDLSTVYGSDLATQKMLRSGKDGKLKVDPKTGLLPTNVELPGVNVVNRWRKNKVFVAGDERVNQDILLQTYHILYMREHNRLCDELRERYPKGLSDGPWTDDLMFTTARTVLAAKNNAVASAYFMSYFKDSMPKPVTPLSVFKQYMGKNWFDKLTINPFKVYPWKRALDKQGRPFALPVEFSIGYRWHDLLPGTVLMKDLSNQTVGVEDIAKSSFSTDTMDKMGFETVLNGMASTQIPHFHSGVSDQLRNVRWNFADPSSQPKANGFDLVAWAIEHERERGCPTFNEYFRQYEGEIPIKPREKFSDFTSDPEKQEMLRQLYDSVEDVDLTVGQELDESYWPHTAIPTSVLALSFYTLARGTYNDRFSLNWILAGCLVEQKPWSCKPTNILQEIMWREVAPGVRWLDPYWMKEFDLKASGTNMLWSMIVRNSELKCLQKNVFFKADEKTNPVVCYDISFFPGPKRPVNEHFAHHGELEPYWTMAAKYGKIVRYELPPQPAGLPASSVLLISSAQFSTKALGQFGGRPETDLTILLRQNFGADGVARLSATSETWKAIREVLKQEDALFGGTTMETLALVSSRAKDLAASLAAKRDLTRPGPALQRFVIQLMGELLFGPRLFGPSSSSSSHVEVVDAFVFLLNHGRQTFTSPSLTRGRLQHYLGVITSFLQHVVDQIPQMGPKEAVWLQKLSKSSLLDRDTLVATSFDALTYSLRSAFAIEYSLFLLGVRPELQEKLVSTELAKIDFSLSSPSSIHQVPLLLKTVKESQRAYAPGGGLLTRLSMEESILDDKQVPSGVAVAVNAHLIHHDPNLYKDPGVFNPHRWTHGSDPEALSKEGVAEGKYLVYGSGAKGCPANKMSLLIHAVALARILEQGEVRYVGQEPPRVEGGGFGAHTVGKRVEIRLEKRI